MVPPPRHQKNDRRTLPRFGPIHLARRAHRFLRLVEERVRYEREGEGSRGEADESRSCDAREGGWRGVENAGGTAFEGGGEVEGEVGGAVIYSRLRGGK